MGKNINTAAMTGDRTRENLYSGAYVSPTIQDGINRTGKKIDKVVEFVSYGMGLIKTNLLSLGIATSTKICKGTCGEGNDCCDGFLDASIGTSTNRTGGIPAGSLDLTFTYDQAIFTSGISKVGFFVAALGEYGQQIIAKFVSSDPVAGTITYTLEGYDAAGLLSDTVLLGAIVNMSLFINDAYIAD